LEKLIVFFTKSILFLHRLWSSKGDWIIAGTLPQSFLSSAMFIKPDFEKHITLDELKKSCSKVLADVYQSGNQPLRRIRSYLWCRNTALPAMV